MARGRYNVLMTTEQGTFIVNKNDLGVGWQLSTNGAYDPDEIATFRSLVTSLARDDVVILDIGANIGVHATTLADLVGKRGVVHAFEAQRLVYYMLAGTVALNSLENVFCHHLAVGAMPGRLEIPQFDFGKPLSFGSVEFGPQQVEEIGQPRRCAPARKEFVDLVSIDSMSFPRVDLMKVDVEGMELDVLKGALRTIQRDRPILFVEYLKGDPRTLARWILDAGYRVFLHNHNFLGLPQGCNANAHGAKEVTSDLQV